MNAKGTFEPSSAQFGMEEATLVKPGQELFDKKLYVPGIDLVEADFNGGEKK